MGNPTSSRTVRRILSLTIFFSMTYLGDTIVLMADGKIFAPRHYSGSLEESAQEAIIVFSEGDGETKAVEDLILKISVTGDVGEFAWVVPFPERPEISKADATMFKELFKYVQDQKSARSRKPRSRSFFSFSKEHKIADGGKGVTVLSREIVGSFEVAVVRETKVGELSRWLRENGYQSLESAADKAVLEFYRKKNYVFACIKVAAGELKAKRQVDLHPLRFQFSTGGRDGIYFPMKLTGLQSDPFDVNLYVFYQLWINDDVSKFGYDHRGFRLNYCDWGHPKSFTSRKYEHLARFMRKHHADKQFYLTNIQASQLNPVEVRHWQDDLWLFPHYTNELFVPYDARPGGVASAAWPNQRVDWFGNDPDVYFWYRLLTHPVSLIASVLLLAMAATALINWFRRRRKRASLFRGAMSSLTDKS